jgi:hypothetical protein
VSPSESEPSLDAPESDPALRFLLAVQPFLLVGSADLSILSSLASELDSAVGSTRTSIYTSSKPHAQIQA